MLPRSQDVDGCAFYAAMSRRRYDATQVVDSCAFYAAMSLCRYAATPLLDMSAHAPPASALSPCAPFHFARPLPLVADSPTRAQAVSATEHDVQYATSPRSSPASRSGRAWPRSELVIDSGSKRTCVVACLSAGALVLVKCSYLRCTCGPPVGCCHPLLAALVLTAGRMLAFLCNS